MIMSHATVIWRKRNTWVISIHQYLVNKGYEPFLKALSEGLSRSKLVRGGIHYTGT